MARVTIADVAKAAGISKAAASYALARRRDKVSHELVERVAAIAERLGWRPNAAARSLRSGCFDRVALIAEDRWRFEHVPPLLLAGMLETLGAQRVDLVLMALPESGPRGWAPRLATESSVDGICLLWDRPALPAWFDEVAGTGTPLLTINRGAEADDVSIDERAGGALLGRLLAAEEHRRIGWSAYWQRRLPVGERHFSVVDRCAGVAAGAGVALVDGPAYVEGGSPWAKPQPPSDDQLAAWRAGLHGWLAGSAAPTAIVCYDRGNLVECAHAALACDPALARRLVFAVFADQAVELPGLDVVTVVLPQREVGTLAAGAILARRQGGAIALRRPPPRLMRGRHAVTLPA